MTSLSNLFRSIITKSDVVELRQIGIRNLSPENNDTKTLSIDGVISDHDQFLEKARMTIEEEKKSLETMRKSAAEDLSAMRKAWEDEKVILQQQAYDEGFQIGFGEGRDKALSDMATAVQLANDVTKTSALNAEQYQVSQERVILELAMRTAERIIGETIDGDETKFLSIVKRALKEVREMKEIKLYVSIDFYKLVSDNREELASIFPPDIPFLIFANEDFDTTECFIETNHGRIVVSVDDQLNELREQLIELVESED